MDNPLVQPDPGLFIWTIVTFLVLLALLAKFAWRPLLDALDKRQESIRKSLDDARRALEKDGVERDLQEELAAQPGALGEELRLVRREWPTDIGPVDLMCRDADGEWVAVGALQQIRHEAVDLSVMIASKIIQRNLSKEDNERLIDEALKQVESRRPLTSQ